MFYTKIYYQCQTYISFLYERMNHNFSINESPFTHYMHEILDRNSLKFKYVYLNIRNVRDMKIISKTNASSRNIFCHYFLYCELLFIDSDLDYLSIKTSYTQCLISCRSEQVNCLNFMMKDFQSNSS